MNAHCLACVGHVTVLEDLPQTVVVRSVSNIIFIWLHFLPNKSLEHISPPGSWICWLQPIYRRTSPWEPPRCWRSLWLVWRRAEPPPADWWPSAWTELWAAWRTGSCPLGGLAWRARSEPGAPPDAVTGCSADSVNPPGLGVESGEKGGGAWDENVDKSRKNVGRKVKNSFLKNML